MIIGLWVEWLKASRRQLLPNPIWLVLQQLPYFSPWYDPSKEGSTELAQAYLNQSPAAMAASAIAANMKVAA